MACQSGLVIVIALWTTVQGVFLNREDPHSTDQSLAAHADTHSVGHYKCDAACQKATKGLNVQSRCVTECEQAMYDCWDHSMGQAQYEACEKATLEKFSKFSD
eukprot:gnl/MRDRNA2_/MRDRNA2_94344_c0_seq1.p1 gnl/MRDRNA2_/MRDRNA2_94344_c0~~gnl/MRDRNA2_/MRDRNA2_94344_c0_seq1.p1  ORF type:complete len:103 (-),score=17.97 gnl/MRDRNA2_/MRDRNA2_94344_c0_seq1:54-362(-)